MSKRKRRERARYLNPYPIARPLPAPLPRLSRLSLHEPILALEDRRTWHPLPFSRPVMALERLAARLVPAVRNRPFKPPLWSGVRFAVPHKVALCVRRNRRKEVLHAKRIAGSGASRFKRRHRNAFSEVSCKR